MTTSRGALRDGIKTSWNASEIAAQERRCETRGYGVKVSFTHERRLSRSFTTSDLMIRRCPCTPVISPFGTKPAPTSLCKRSIAMHQVNQSPSLTLKRENALSFNISRLAAQDKHQ